MVPAMREKCVQEWLAVLIVLGGINLSRAFTKHSAEPFPSGVRFGDEIKQQFDYHITYSVEESPAPFDVDYSFYGKSYSVLQPSNYGAFVTSTLNVTQWGPPVDGISAYPAMVAWGSVVNMNTDPSRTIGQVRSRRVDLESATACNLLRLIQEVGFVNMDTFTATDIILTTYSDVSCWGCTHHFRNSFQLAFVTDGTLSFVVKLYGQLTWPMGEFSADWWNIPLVGFMKGDGETLYETAASRNEELVLGINEQSNVGKPGIFVYEVSGEEIVDVGNVPDRGAPLSCAPLEYDECDDAENVCFNEGTCFDPDLLSLGSTTSCTCTEGFTGPDCTISFDECVSTCRNHDTCTDPDLAVLGDFDCECAPFFTGESCTVDIDECAEGTHECLDSAHCENLYGSYRCLCPEGWPVDVPCMVGFSEDCPDAVCEHGWTGADCQTDVDECSQSACYMGDCENTEGGFACACDDGWEGRLCATPVAAGAAPVVVETEYGTVEGRAVDGLRVFRGVPFAQPPVGQLRFQPPQAPSNWGSMETVSFGPACLQGDRFPAEFRSWIPQDEDCLYMNIYAPTADPLNPAGYPVLFHIQGLLNQAEDGSRLHDAGAYLASESNAIYVSFNYRLGAMGFYNADGATPNNGLRDQMMALQFVASNIAAFGGDPEKVIAFGSDSQSAVAVDLLRMLPQTSGLLAQCIKFGGSWRDPQAFGDTEAASAQLRSQLACSTDCCVRQLRTHWQITSAADQMAPTLLRFPFAFDAVDTQLFPDGLEALAAAAPPLTCLHVYHEQESALFTASSLFNAEPFGIAYGGRLDEIAAKLADKFGVDLSVEKLAAIAQIFTYFYTDPDNKRGDSMSEPSKMAAMAASRAFSDVSFYAPALDALYNGDYGHNGDQYLLLNRVKHAFQFESDDSIITGSTHTDSLADLMHRPVGLEFSTDADTQTVQSILEKFVYTFCHEGAPWTKKSKKVEPKTKPFKKSSGKKHGYFNLQSNKPKMGAKFAAAADTLYNNFIPAVVNAGEKGLAKKVKKMIKKLGAALKKAGSVGP